MLATLVVLLGAGSAGAAPVWRLSSLANTTAAPGSVLTYHLTVTDVGNVASDGSEVDLIVALAPGLSAESAGGGGFSCTAGDGVSPVTGASVLKCTSFDTFQPFGRPGVTVVADVAPGASGTRTSSFAVSGGGANPLTVLDPTLITSTAPGFGVDGFDAAVTADPEGDAFTQAGGHPYAAGVSIDVNTIANANPFIGDLWPVEPIKDVLTDLPPGFVGYPTAAAKCTGVDLANSAGINARPLCPPASQVGTTLLRVNLFGLLTVFGPYPVFNLIPPPGVPARFGFNALGTVVTLDGELRNGSDYGVSVNVRNVSEGLPIAGTDVTLWGVPADPSHDFERACPGQAAPGDLGPSCPAGVSRTAFLRNPTSCTPVGVGLPTAVHVDSWTHPGVFQDASSVSHDPPGYPAPPSARGPADGPSSCEKVPFDPTLTATSGTPATPGAPSGFTFDVNLPQSTDPDAIGEADLKKTVVTLPEGVRISPASADGLRACTQAQIALGSNTDPSCPEQSKVGSMTITTPVLDQPLTGAIYLATPHENPSGSLISVYLVAKGPGVIIKQAGQIEADPTSGQITARFDNIPQLPFSNLHLEFMGGPRAPLVTPTQCGTYTTHAELTSWSGKTVSSDSNFVLSADGNGAPCPPAKFSPAFSAGVENTQAGKDSSFLLALSRDDQDQQLRSLSVSMPGGLLGRVAGTVLCADAAASAGTCGDGSKLGDVTVGAGAGTSPFFITNGRAYITGPYKGAPFGLSIVVPAVAGPFDLGNVVVRAAIYVDRNTAQLRIVSDPLPTILQGIPLDVRVVRVAINRPKFIINPTSCAAKQVKATIGSIGGMVARVASRFRVGECENLTLAPKLTLSVGAKHHTKAGVTAPFSTTITQKPGQSNLRTVSVSLPTTLNARLGVVNQACTLAQFHAGHCTAKARVGSAVAITPILRDPLKGSVYFVKNPARALPDLMVALRGQVNLDLTGKVTIPGGTHLATTFDTIPDAPITKFTLKLVSGANGPIGTAVNLCSTKGTTATATLGIRGQSGELVLSNPRLHINGCPKPRSAKR